MGPRTSTDRLEARLHDLDNQLRRARQEFEQLDRLLRERALERTTVALTQSPRHLLAGAGPPPQDRAGRARWQRAAYLIERYRLDWDVHDRTLPLGHLPDDQLQRRARARAMEELQRLTRSPRRDRGWDLGRAIVR